MDALLDGLTVLVNGLMDTASAVLSPLTAMVVVLAVTLAWFTRVELDEIDRSNSKPEVGLH